MTMTAKIAVQRRGITTRGVALMELSSRIRMAAAISAVVAGVKGASDEVVVRARSVILMGGIMVALLRLS